MNKGVINLSNNFNNVGSILFDLGCVTLSKQNFVNSGSLSREGNIIVENGDIFNISDWATSVLYCVSGMANNVPVAENCNEVDEICDCAQSNFDILLGYNTDNKSYSLLGQNYFL